MTVLVTGARGAVGRGVLDGLLAAGTPAAAIRAAGRDPSRLAVPAGVATVALDLGDSATWASALDGVDEVFCYATGDLAAFAAAARDAGISHVVLLSSAAVSETGAEQDALAGAHADAERALRGAGLTTTALRPGAFCGNTAQWAREIRAEGVVGLPYPHATTAPIHEGDIAAVAVALLTGAAAGERGADLPLTGPESLSFAEQVDVLTRELGRDVGVRPVDPDAAREQMARHVPPGIVDSLFRLWRTYDGVPTEVVGTVERVTGHAPRPFAAWVREHRDLFVDDAAGA